MTKRRRHDHAETLLRETGARVTRPRIEVLAALLSAEHALTHHEVEKRVDRALAIDRVTIYRVLEWLTANALAHKIAGDDRVWRFNAAERGHAHRHAHFQCSRCGTVLCLDEPGGRPSIRLPAGFRSQHVELTVKGLCAGCVPAPSSRGRRGARPQRH